MMLLTALIALLLQAALPQGPAGKASIAGVVVNENGEPIPNVRVSLGRMNVNLGPFMQLIVGERPPVETTIPAEALAAIAGEMENEIQTGGVPPEFAAQAAAFKSVPTSDIHEIVVSPNGSMMVVPKSLPPVMTDDRGRFAFNDVDPGTYKVMFAGGGYAKQEYGQRTAGGGVPLTLTAGQAKNDIVMRLMAVAAVGGRVRNSTGQAVAGVTVQLFRFSYDETGQRKVQRVTAARSDDRGEYRMYYLTPGRYYASAGNEPGENTQNFGVVSGLEALMFGTGYTTANRIAQNYTITYYPGVPDESAARPIDVQSGADVRDIDFFVTPQQTYRVRGRIVDSRTGQPPATASVSLNVQSPDPANIVFYGGVSGSSNYKPADGSFEFQNVSSGTYSLSASIPNPPQSRPTDFANMSPAERNAYFQAQQAAESARPKASATLRVNGDIDGVLLTLGLSGSVAGRLRVESNTTTPATVEFMRVQLRGGSAAANDPLSGGGMQPRPVTPEGTFRIDNVWPGEYRVSVAGIPPGFYVKEAKVGDTDVLDAPFRFTGTDSRPLDVVISSNIGVVDGTALDAAGKPMPGAQVVLIPANRARTELFRPVTADINGRFSMTSVAPGDYMLAAWEALEPNAFFDPNAIRQAEASGKALRVGEGSTQTVNVSAMPVSAR